MRATGRGLTWLASTGPRHTRRRRHLSRTTQLETQLSEVPRDKWGHPILPIPENIERKEYEQRTARAADRAREDAVVGARQQRARARRCSKGETRPARAARSSACASTSTPATRVTSRCRRPPTCERGPVVLPAVRRATADPRRDRVLRPLLVQPGRRRARDGLRDRRSRSIASSIRSCRSKSSS